MSDGVTFKVNLEGLSRVTNKKKAQDRRTDMEKSNSIEMESHGESLCDTIATPGDRMDVELRKKEA